VIKNFIINLVLPQQLQWSHSMAYWKTGSRSWAITLVRMTKKSHLYRHRKRMHMTTSRVRSCQVIWIGKISQ